LRRAGAPPRRVAFFEKPEEANPRSGQAAEDEESRLRQFRGGRPSPANGGGGDVQLDLTGRSGCRGSGRASAAAVASCCAALLRALPPERSGAMAVGLLRPPRPGRFDRFGRAGWLAGLVKRPGSAGRRTAFAVSGFLRPGGAAALPRSNCFSCFCVPGGGQPQVLSPAGCAASQLLLLLGPCLSRASLAFLARLPWRLCLAVFLGLRLGVAPPRPA